MEKQAFWSMETVREADGILWPPPDQLAGTVEIIGIPYVFNSPPCESLPAHEAWWRRARDSDGFMFPLVKPIENQHFLHPAMAQASKDVLPRKCF